MVLKLKEYCRKNGIALAEVSRRCGISRVSLSRYAHGVQSMTLDQLSKIVSALGCRVEDLVDDRIVRRLDSSGFIAKAYDYGVSR